MFDYDDTVNLAFDAKIAGKKLVTAKHELLTKTGDFLFLAHSDKELAQRMQMVEEDIEKVAYRKLANVSDSKAKLVRAIYDEWSIRHANCDFCKEAKNVSNDGGGRGKAPAMQSMMTAVPGAQDPGIVQDVTDTAKGVAHAVGTGVGDVARGELGVAKAVGTGIADVAKGEISGAGSLISQFTQGLKGNSTPAAADKASGFSSAADVAAHQQSNNSTPAPAKPVGPSIGQGPAPTAPTAPAAPAKPVGPSIGQGPAPTAPTAPGKNLVQQFPGSMLAPAGQARAVTTTTSSDSDADGDVDMDRAASKIANLSKLLKGSNDTNFIG